jgi:hypothetical protein
VQVRSDVFQSAKISASMNKKITSDILVTPDGWLLATTRVIKKKRNTKKNKTQIPINSATVQIIKNPEAQTQQKKFVCCIIQISTG